MTANSPVLKLSQAVKQKIRRTSRAIQSEKSKKRHFYIRINELQMTDK